MSLRLSTPFRRIRRGGAVAAIKLQRLTANLRYASDLIFVDFFET
jgi:hypothetical protein